ncbi:MAG: DUF167 domain-containing protein [Thaumarchaeota archaeon]|nr:DUF167 domain-containing protein [Nitrososphaerota archaeon]MBI3642415.1 DUF167 domain-containing protein [Nitrososphaerota archaeon]
MIYKVSVTFHKDFIEVNNDEVSVGIKSKPEKGEANRELIKKLSKHFNVSQSQVKITSGEKSRKKLIQIIT